MIVADALLMILGFIALVFASANDIRTREVPDWLSYSLIISGFGVRIFHSLIFSDLWYLLYGLVGFGVMLILGLIMYYSKQWGGGDTKLVMGLGVVFTSSSFSPQNFLVSLGINIIIFGALYGLCWSAYLALKNKKVFVKSLVKSFNEKRNLRIFSLIFGLLVVVSVFFIPLPYVRFIFCMAALSLVSYAYLHVFVKAVEDCCMYKWLPVSKLTEGDWVAKPVYVKSKLVCGPQDLGLEKYQINVLKKSKIKRVLVKEGIPFVPSFLIAAIVTFFGGNVLFIL